MFKLQIFLGIVLALAAIFIPLLVDIGLQTLGWEYPKVIATNLLSITIISICATILWFKHRSWRSLPESIKPVHIIFGILLILTLIVPLLQDAHLLQTKLLGSPYRWQGLGTISLLMLSGWLLIMTLDRTSSALALIGLFITGSLQAIFGWQQVFKLSDTFGFQAVVGSEYIFGTLGQSNFWSGVLLVGIAAGIWLVAKSKYRWLKAILISWLILMTAIIFISGSIGAKHILIFSPLSIALIALAPKFGWKIYATTRLALVILLPSLFAILNQMQVINDHRSYIWQLVLTQFNRNGGVDLVRVVFGNGFDVMGDTFRELGLGAGGYIDRAHNLGFDVLFAMGIVGLVLLVWLLFKLLQKPETIILTDKHIKLTALAVLFLFDVVILRSIIHTSSIFNLWLMIVVVAIVWRNH